MLRRFVPIRRLVLRLRLLRWVLGGRSGPPPSLVKQAIVREYRQAYDLRVLIETGTYMGDMVEAVRNDFEAIYSIELGKSHHDYARRRLASYPWVHLLLGDSGQVLGQVLERVTVPSLFWLDGHYAGGTTARAAAQTPILQELEAIAGHPVKNHVVLIDDAQYFNGTNDYPDLESLRAVVARLFPGSAMEVSTGVIRIVCARRQSDGGTDGSEAPGS